MRLIDASLRDIEELINREISRLKERFVSPPDPHQKSWLTNSEAMEYLGLSRSTLQRYRDKGILSFTKLGSNIYYSRKQLDELLGRSLRCNSNQGEVQK